MSDLNSLLTQFVNSNERNISLDFYSRNQIVLQLYKLCDVKTWNYGIEEFIKDDIIIELTFNKNKIDNQNNKHRFFNSDVFRDFIKMDSVKEYSYWTGVDIKLSINTIKQMIIKIINAVYNLKNETIEFKLIAY
jgi:hypothetical protein